MSALPTRKWKGGKYIYMQPLCHSAFQKGLHVFGEDLS